MKNNIVITIGRQYGSGGHEIGERLAKILGIPLYDKNLIEMAAEEMGISGDMAASGDETVLNNFLSYYTAPGNTFGTAYGVNADYGRSLSDRVFLTQSSIVQSLAERGPCVIVGRCADYLLKGNPNCINVFIHASHESCVNRIMRLYDMSEKDAAEQIKKVNRHRKNYYETYTKHKWGDMDSYQIILNSSLLGTDMCIDILEMLYDTKSAPAK